MELTEGGSYVCGYSAAVCASATVTPPRMPEGEKRYITTLLLSFFLGFWGVDRFYLGKRGSGLAKLLTFGGFGYWWLIDLLITLFGGQRDAFGFRLAGYDRYKKAVWITIGVVYGGMFALGVLAILFSAVFGSGGNSSLGLVLLGIIVVVIGGIFYFRKRNSTKEVRRARAADPLPPAIRKPVDMIVALRPDYAALAASGHAAAGSIVGLIDTLQSNAIQLFTRLATRADKHQRVSAEGEYDDKLSKLATALNHGYLLVIIANPRLWESPDRRVRDVVHAVEAVDAQMLDNIRQVNAHHGLVFQVSIDGLIGPSKAMDDWDRAYNEASGAE